MTNYQNPSAAALFLGVILMAIGFVMGGVSSVTWAGFIGAGIALTIHGGLATPTSFVLTSSRSQSEHKKTPNSSGLQRSGL